MSDEIKVMTAILHAVQTVPGVVVFDPPSMLRNSKPASREAYRRALGEAFRRVQMHPRGALLWRHNVGAASLPAGGGRMRPVFFGLPGQPDIDGVLWPSGRRIGREVKDPTRRETKRGKLGGFLSQPTKEQEAWGEIYAFAGASWAVWRSSEEAVADMRALLEQERAATLKKIA